MSIASLILGIVSLLIVIFSMGSVSWLGSIVAIVGIVLGADYRFGSLIFSEKDT